MALKLKVRNLVTQLAIVSKGLTTSRMIGNYKSAYKGSGLEFDGFRAYQQQDDSSLIDWKASVRVNGLLVKEFREERNLNIFFLFDVSNSMLFGSTQKLKHKYAAELIASMAYTSIESDDGVGLAMFNDKVVRGLKILTGEQQFYSILGSLTNTKLYGGRYDLDKALEFTLQFLETGSLLIIVSDFIGLSKNWEEKLKVVSSKFDVIALMIRDPRDRELPNDSGDVVVGDPYGKEKISIRPKSVGKKYTSYVKQQEKVLEDKFKRLGTEFVSLSTDKDFVNPLIKMFKGRESKYR
jgi:uncharacterized protein (DUF58 family)